MKNILTVTCNTPPPPLVQIGQNSPFLCTVTPVTRVTSVTKCNTLHFLHQINSIRFFKYLLLIFLLLSHLPNNAQTVTRVTLDATPTKKGKVVFRKLTAEDLPDFSKAIDINQCDPMAINYDMNQLPVTSTVGGRKAVINEHLQHLPNSNLRVIQYLQYGDDLLRNNLCPNWITFKFNAFGQLPVTMFWTVDNFFVITSDDEPSCEVILWFQAAHIPMGRGHFLNCLN